MLRATIDPTAATIETQIQSLFLLLIYNKVSFVLLFDATIIGAIEGLQDELNIITPSF